MERERASEREREEKKASPREEAKLKGTHTQIEERERIILSRSAKERRVSLEQKNNRHERNGEKGKRERESQKIKRSGNVRIYYNYNSKQI